MTPLGRILRRRIAQTGPISLADYMAECLMHPQYGYYNTRDPFGQAGDFTTAPEISQMFGELMGLALAQSWLDQGAPTPFILAECGPGRGTLMADLLRATRHVPGFHAGMQLCLLEGSPLLRKAQAGALREFAPSWTERTEDLPNGPLFVIANEFFDALPIRQFTRMGNAWAETVIGLEGDRLVPGRTVPTPLKALVHRLADTDEGTVVETRPMGEAIIATLGSRITAQGGAAIVIDYGDGPSRGDTFQAVAKHGFTDPLNHPGEADLTAHVDFQALAHAALPACSTGLTPQGLWLARLGIGPRAERLAAGLSGAALENHRAATHRLTHGEEMGTLFKAMALYPPDQPAPPGFE
ncbi:MAG: class I SAM-dependent methyltransferase [Pseudorhodobacter sp.]